MRITNFEIYRDILKEKSGLDLTLDKSYMLESRLSPVSKKWGYLSFEAMTTALQGVPDKNLVNDIVEAMTINDTAFFRDDEPFNALRDVVLPYLLKKRSAEKKIRIWCAACSSGQEPYSAALTIREKGLPAGWKTEILGTDIASDILEQAKSAVYSQFEVQRGLPLLTLLKYFTQDDTKWVLQDDVRKMARFDYFNLMDDVKKLGTFDVIFCRNVLSFFEDKTKKKVLEKVASRLEKDGFLFLGKTETTIGLSEAFKPLPGVAGLYAFADGPHHKGG